VEADPTDPSKLRGFDVEIAAELGRRMGRAPRFVQVAYASIDQSVDRGDFEIGFSGVEDTPGRRAALSVTVPYFEFREVLSTRAGEEGRFPTLASLRGRRVGTLGGTIAYEILLAAEKDHGVVAVSYDDDVHPYEDVVKGRLDAVLLDHVLALRALTRTGGLAIVPGSVATGWYVGVLAKANGKRRDEVDRHLADMMRDGTLARIFTAWGLEDEAQRRLRERVLAAGAEGAAHAEASAAATPRSPAVPTGAAGGEGPQRTRTADAVRAYLPALFRAALVTIALSCLAMTLAVSTGVIVATGRIYGPRPLSFVLAAWVEVTRGTPVLLQLFVLYYGLSGFVRLPAFLAAVIGLGLNYAAYESEIYRGALEAVGKTQLEAARTLGFTEMQALRLVRGPLAFRLALAPMTNDFVALLKDSSLVSVITVVELTKQTSIFAVNLGSWLVPGLLCGSIYLAMSLPLARVARRLEERWKGPS
jgi:polar amino acid transport system substrate-binding protein